MHRGILIEACVETLFAAEQAVAAGADRLELCDFRIPDGATPDLEAVKEVLRMSPVPVHVLVRGGDDRREIVELKELGVAGVVIGALRSNRELDQDSVRRLLELARPLAVTFHRAFDSTPDPGVALEVLVQLGVNRVLTSGRARDAEAGIPGLRHLVQRAGGRIGVIAAGGIRGHNVGRIVRETGVREIHSRGEIAPIVQALGAG